MKNHIGLEAHDGYAPHSHEVRADHAGIPFIAQQRWETQEAHHLADELGEQLAGEWISVMLDLSPDGRTVSIWDALRFALDARRNA